MWSDSAAASGGETWVVELTPPGRGAVAVILVAGPRALSAVAGCFTAASGRALADVPLGRISLGRWGGADGEELIVCRRATDEIEVHCHGGLAAASAIIERLADGGCRRIFWAEWLRRTSHDRIQADAQIALAGASTARTAAVLLDQYNGTLRRALDEVAGGIRSGDWSRSAEIIDAILAHRDVGLHLTTPWRVVIAGPPNVGKSSLINALAGYQRSIVWHEAGTTRDVVTTKTAIDGWPVQLADTAGLRAASDELEAAGIALAESAIAAADLVVLVRDATAPSNSEQDIEFAFDQREPVSKPPPPWGEGGGGGSSGWHQRVPKPILPAQPGVVTRVIRVTNKIDLVAAAAASQDINAGHVVATSALTGEGISKLIAAIGQKLVPAAPPAGAAVAFTAEQFLALDSARPAIDAHDADAALAALQPLLATPSST